MPCASPASRCSSSPSSSRSGFYQLARHFLAEVEPQTFQATEEMMVDTANLLAEMVERDMHGGILRCRPTSARHSTGAHDRKFEARIFDHLKQRVGINAYITDAKGKVIFDSDGGSREGQDLHPHARCLPHAGGPLRRAQQPRRSG